MGAKTALLAFADGDLVPAVLGATRCDLAEAEELVRLIHPGYDVTPIGDGTLSDSVYPPDDITYATVLAGAELLCDRRLMFDRPSELPERLLKLGAGRRIVVHGMHSVVDGLSFAVWDDGTLVRSLSLSPDSGIAENIGEPFDFELPYWDGAHPVRLTLYPEDTEPYPLPFHPLELGEEALRALFGFVIEGFHTRDDIDGEAVHLHGFRVDDPSGQEQAARRAAYERVRRAMRPPRQYRMGSDGKLHEYTSPLDDLRTER